MTAVDVDALDKLREAATGGEWGSPEYTSTVYGGDPAHLLRVASSVHPEDAALIVAAVNALPDLIAAVRERDALREAVEGLATEFERMPRLVGTYAADRLRTVVAAVDGGGQP